MKKHIIVIRNDQIGDMALSSPLFQKIKEVWPDSILTVIASSISLQLAKLIVPVDHCILDFKQTFRTTLIKSLLFTVKELKKLNIDMIIFARMDPFYVYAAFFAGIKVRVGDKNNVLLNPLLTQKVNVCCSRGRLATRASRRLSRGACRSLQRIRKATNKSN